MPENYSNRQGVSQYLVRTQVRQHRPYVANSYSNQLTYKEQLARQQLRTAHSGGQLGGFSGGGGSGIGLGGIGGGTVQSSQGNFFSPQLSTDFLELPQSLRERREIYRHFYNSDELVGQALDLHTELPLSKVRLAAPKPRKAPEGFSSPENYGKYILDRFERMCKRIKLFQRLITMTHHFWLDGVCLPGDELVTVEGGCKAAADVRVGDLVLTHKGRWRPVTVILEREAPELISLDVARIYDTLRLTPEHPVETMDGFKPAGDLQVDDFVKVTWPTEVSEVATVDLLSAGVPSYVSKTSNGYKVVRTQVRPRTPEAVKAREYLLNWLISLSEPVRRSRKDIAESAGVSEYTLNNVILTLDKDIPFTYRTRIPTGPKHKDHTLWFPVSGLNLSRDSYVIIRNWEFTGPTTLPVNEDFLYILGYWLGDGSLTRDSSRTTEWGRGSWRLFFGKPSFDFSLRAEDILVRLFGRSSVVRSFQEREDGDMHVLDVVGNPAFVEWWSTNFGDTSHGLNPKRIPLWVQHLPLEKQLHLVAGLIDSDGCVPKTHVGGVQIGLTSLNLISAIRDIFLRLGAVPTLSRQVRDPYYIKNRLVEDPRDVYILRITEEAPARRLVEKSSKKCRLDLAPRFTETPNSYIENDSGVFFKVRDVGTLPGCKVYSFQVDEDETFRAHFVSTHNCVIFAEDSEVQDIPFEVGHQKRTVKTAVLDEDGNAVERETTNWEEDETTADKEFEYYRKNYQGWSKIIVLPIDKVEISTFSYTDKSILELIPSNRDKALLERARNGDPTAAKLVEEIPHEVRDHIENGRLIPLGTDPDEGSFAYVLTGSKSSDEQLGQSILNRCLRTLYYREKLRQAQTSIASRAMTPKRIVWAEGLSDVDVDQLREQVDLSLVDPDYSIVANYEIHWEEMGSRDRLLDLSTEYEQTERRLLAGLGVTESLMSGESLYSGDRLKLEVMNNRYLHLREILQEYVEEYLFRPVAERMGFVEEDEWGQKVVLFPKLSFTRLPLRDSQDTFDALYNLYSKGSISIDLILEMLNIDPNDTRVKIENDMFTVNDAIFNEILRSLYNEVGRMLAEKTDVIERISKYMDLKLKPEKPEGDEGGGRF